MLAFRLLVSSAAILFGSGAALASTLDGTTFCGSSRMVGATVEATSLATGLVAGTATTNGNGQYALGLDNGTYDLLVTPPAGSGCSQQLIQSKQVSGSETYDIVLVLPPGILQGTFTVNGSPVSGVTIRYYGSGNSNYQVTTDVNGHYELQLASGNYSAEINLSDNGRQLFPNNVNCYNNVSVNGDTTVDYAWNVVVVEGTVTSTPSNSPVAGVSIDANMWANGCDAWSSTSSASDGSYQFRALANSNVNINTRAIAGVVGATNTQVSAPASGSVTKDINVAELTAFSLLGRITGLDGAPAAGVTLSFWGDGNYAFTTDADGYFLYEGTQGNYEVYFSVGNHPVLPQNLWCDTYLSINENTSLDFVVPTGVVSGTVIPTPSNTPRAGIPVRSDSWGSTGLGWCNANAYTNTASDGTFGPIRVLANSGVNVSSERVGTDLGQASTSVSVAANGSVEVTLNPPEQSAFVVTGAVKGRNGELMSYANLNFDGPTYASSNLSNGSYSVSLVPGNYYFYMNGGSSNPEVGASFNCDGSVNFAEATTYDINIPFVRISGRITNSSGIPIQGVSISTDSNRSTNFWCNSSSSTTSDADGRYTLAALAGSANFRFDPPSSSGYQGTNVSTNLSSDIKQVVVLQLPDTVPPVITVGPLVIHHSDTSVSIQWSTNEVTDAKLEYQLGTELTSPTVLTRASTSTNHLFTLTGLSPESTYTFRVSGKDGGQNPVESAPATFLTNRDPDTTPPLITDGPTAVFVSPTLIRVRWLTNEPSDSVVVVATDGSVIRTLSNGAFVLDHDVVINALSPTTLYAINVASTDPDLNTSAAHEPLLVRTPAVVDTTPPVVSNLRSECTTDSAISVCWDTNEAATGAVTYINQDTGAAATVSSPALTTSRCIGLSNLSPQTQYSISVASSDGGGNIGNGGPLLHSTLSNALGGSPVVTNLSAAAVGATGARITWTTDRPASTLVQYGPSATDLPNTAGNVAASETSHTVQLSGLTPGQSTWVRVVSTNQCQQTTTSEAVLVTDIDECLTGSAGCDANAICTHTIGSSTCACAPGFSGNGKKCCADCTGGRERATDCGGDPFYGCDFRPTLANQTLQVFAGSVIGTPVGSVLATDGDAGDTLAWSIIGGNAGLPFMIDTATGVLKVQTTAQVDANVNQSIVLTVRVTDAIGLSQSATITIQVQPKPGPCAESPCVHGTCVEVGDTATCDCSGSGYSGPICNIDVDECQTNNGGCADVCVNDPGAWHCDCADGGVLAGDGISCLAAGSCVSIVTCDEVSTDLVFYGVVADDDGRPVGSIRCVRAATGGVTCDTNPDGTLAVSPTLWCSTEAK